MQKVIIRLTCLLVFVSCFAQPSTSKKESSSNKEGIDCCVEELLKTTGKIDAVPSPVNGSKRYHLNGYI